MSSAKPGGVGQYTCDGVVTQVDTSTCAHCAKITEIPSRRKMTDVTDICRLCMRLVCLQCAGKPCAPWLKKIERMEAEFYRKSQLMKMMGL